MVGAHIFSIKKNTLLCILDHYSKLPAVKETDSLLVDDLIRVAVIVFTEFGLSNRIVSDVGMNFVSDKFKQFCRQLNIEQVINLSYHHQSNGQVEACVKFVKCAIKMPW